MGIRNAMIATAKDKGDAGCDVNYGHGIVQTKAAFEFLEANQCDPNEPFKEPQGVCAEFSCSEDSDCDDGNPDTIDTCDSGSCQHVCGSDAACDDGDDCTADTCTDGVCSSVMDCSICGGGGTSVLELTTDNYPGETEWNIKNSSGDEKYNGSGYSDAHTLHSINMCLASDEYTFTITDAYGDGICCSYGNGGYKITVDDTEVVNGGDFGNSETETFTVNGPAPTNPSAPPTTAPVTNPTAPPTTAPVTTPSGCVMFVITLNTDDYGYETSFTLINDFTRVTRLAGGLYSSSKSFDEVTCLDNGRYIFTISDSHGDGMCCDSGQGSYKLTLGGEAVKEGGEFGESESFVVEVGPQGPSRAPTPAPTCIQDGGSCTFGDSCCSGRCGNNVCEG